MCFYVNLFYLYLDSVQTTWVLFTFPSFDGNQGFFFVVFEGSAVAVLVHLVP